MHNKRKKKFVEKEEKNILANSAGVFPAFLVSAIFNN